jgi:hypothetical protein
MIQGPEPGSIYRLPDNRVTTIGRASRNTIRVASSSVSRFHCEVVFVNGQWELNDLNSRQGTLVNGQRVQDRAVLAPGDVIRLSTTVFRFDMVDEPARETEALVAIKEAELDLRLRLKGEGLSTLAEIQARSRVDSERFRHDRVEDRHMRAVNRAFMGAVAVAVAVICAGLLAYAHAAAPARSKSPEAQARAALEDALAALRNGDDLGGARMLAQLCAAFPGTRAAAEAAGKCEQATWAAVEGSLDLVADKEAANDYAAAMRAYGELGSLAPGQAAKELLGRRRECTVRLAHAYYRSLAETAERRVKDGDVQEAVKLYRRAAERVGVEALAVEAQQRADELEKQARR